MSRYRTDILIAVVGILAALTLMLVAGAALGVELAHADDVGNLAVHPSAPAAVQELGVVADRYWGTPLPCTRRFALMDSTGFAAVTWPDAPADNPLYCVVAFNRVYLGARLKRIRDPWEQRGRALDVCVTALHEDGHLRGFGHDLGGVMTSGSDRDDAPWACRVWARARVDALHGTAWR